MEVIMWKKLRDVALIATVLTPIACIHTCCCCDSDPDLLLPPPGFYKIYENTPADCNESESGKEQKETQELQQKQTPATPAEKQNTP